MINKLSYKLIKQARTKSEQIFSTNIILSDFLKDNNSNILVIQASNSSGKSFILKLLAFAFYGLELNNEELTDSLQRELKYLVDETHQTFEFEFSFNDPDGSIIEINYTNDNKKPIIKKIRDKTEIILTKEMFLKEYKLIFDIPEKPLDRIFQVIKSIKEYNSNLLNKLDPLDIKIDDILRSIRDERNEELIFEIKDRIDIKKQNLESYTQKSIHLKTILQDLENYKNVTLLKKNIIDIEENSSKIEDLSIIFNKLKVPDLIKNDLKSNQKIKEIKSNIKNLNINYLIKSLENQIKDNEFSDDILKNISSNDKVCFNIIYSSSDLINNYIENNENENIAQLNRNLTYIKDSFFKNYFEKLKNDSNGEDYFLIQNLIKDFNKYENTENSIFEELFTKQISTIIQELKEKENKNSKIIRVKTLEESINNIIDNIISKLKISNELSKALFKELGKNNSLPLEEKKYNSLKNELFNLNELKTKLKSNNQNLRSNLESNGIPLLKLDNIQSLNEVLIPLNIKNKPYLGKENIEIENANTEIKQFNKLISQINNEIIEDELKYKNENSKLSSSYSKHKGKLNVFSNKLSFFIKYLRKNNSLIKDNGELIGKEDELNSPYIKLIGEFVASTMGNKIIYQNETVDISYVDYSSETPSFVTTNEKRIAFPDFSGGQASSNYLKSKLNLNDEKKYIVLFDEIANMDNRSLNEVIVQLKKLNDNNKLLLAILVEPDKNENVYKINAY